MQRWLGGLVRDEENAIQDHVESCINCRRYHRIILIERIKLMIKSTPDGRYADFLEGDFPTMIGYATVAERRASIR